MINNAKSLWEECRLFIKDNIQPEQYNNIFAFVEFGDFADGKLVLEVPSAFVKEVIENTYLDLLSKTLHRYFGEVTLFYRVLQIKKPVITNDESSSNCPRPNTPKSTEPANVVPNLLSTPTVSELDSHLNLDYNFDTYIEGASNRLARSVGEAIAKDPSKTFNPLFVFGPSGCGKSHLVNAIGLRIKQLHPQLRVLYVSAHLFMVQWTDAVRKNVKNDFIAFYQTIDVLIIDDIQELSGKKDTQNTFFHIFNHLHLNKKQIILTADRPPVDILGLEDRLLTRFKWGLQAEIERPTRELRQSIVSAKVNKEGLNIPNKVINFISEKIDDSVRDLEGIINSLMAYSVVYDCDIDMNLVGKIMPRFKAVESTESTITFDTIRDKVCEFFGVKAEVLTSRIRKQPISYIRQLAIYLADKHTDDTIVEIGLKMGGRNHATVLHSIKNIKSLQSVDSKTRADIENIENALFQA